MQDGFILRLIVASSFFSKVSPNIRLETKQKWIWITQVGYLRHHWTSLLTNYQLSNWPEQINEVTLKKMKYSNCPTGVTEQLYKWAAERCRPRVDLKGSRIARMSAFSIPCCRFRWEQRHSSWSCLARRSHTAHICCLLKSFVSRFRQIWSWN